MISADSLNRKMCRLGITFMNYKEKQKEMVCVRLDDGLAAEAHDWCNTNLGDNWIWSSPLQSDYTDFFFLTPEDALVFKLTFIGKNSD